VPRPSTVRYTWADYLSTPEDTSRRYEIVDGGLFVTAAPRARHQEVVANLVETLGGLTRSHHLGKVLPGPITVRLHDELVVEPDLIFIRADRLGIVDPEGVVDGPPDLVVEILSPSNRSYDRNLKRKHYLENGIPELWILDADERIVEVWRPGDTELRCPATCWSGASWSIASRSRQRSCSGVDVASGDRNAILKAPGSGADRQPLATTSKSTPTTSSATPTPTSTLSGVVRNPSAVVTVTV
jgi:Uma2 family endonuclease